MNLLDEAAEMLGRAADGMPGYARPRYNQALALLKLKRYEEGEQALLQVVRQEPENPRILHHSGKSVPGLSDDRTSGKTG